jgi:hypothetical protein
VNWWATYVRLELTASWQAETIMAQTQEGHSHILRAGGVIRPLSWPPDPRLVAVSVQKQYSHLSE